MEIGGPETEIVHSPTSPRRDSGRKARISNLRSPVDTGIAAVARDARLV